jgi:superfamily II DNA helicase RecQ
VESGPIADPVEPFHQVLRDWRTATALGLGVAEAGVLSDSVLARIAEFRPRNRESLRQIEGIGPRALAKWGEALLGLIRRHDTNESSVQHEGANS